MNPENWLGREEERCECLDLRTARLMQSIFQTSAGLNTGDSLPPLWHWLYFPEAERLEDLGRDGHSKRGSLIPPVPLPRRMWAGSRINFLGALPLGARVTRRSRVVAIKEKVGRTGSLCFVTLERSFQLGGRTGLLEEQDLVFRGDAEADPPPHTRLEAPNNPDFLREISPNSVMLFRYSALTFNSHRIHYDRDYCRTVEGYPGLVVHGPLLATLLAEFACRQANRKLRTFSFKALRPLFDISPFRLAGKISGAEAELWIETEDGDLALTAKAGFET